MPQSIQYRTILEYVSNSRIDSFKNTFDYGDDAEIYGVYIWSQQASASLYPVMQNLEVTLRNAIDNEAVKRFGTYWWDTIKVNGPRSNCKFFDQMKGAKRKLDNEWKKKERKRLGLPEGSTLPASSALPTWSHNKIVAATDFSTWEFILVDSFSTNIRAEKQNFLFPKSMGKIFKNYSVLSNNQNTARKELIDLINEVREYRNRLFHHEPVWIKSVTVTNDQTAIDTIRKKINRAEKILNVINIKKLEALSKVGIFRHARRICSKQELSIYTYKNYHHTPTIKQKRTIRKILSSVNNESIAFGYGDSTYSLYKVR